MASSHAFAALTVLVLLAGCPAGSRADADRDAGTSGAGGGPSTTVALGCTSDQACAVGEVCELSTKECKLGLDCSGNAGRCNFCGEGETDCGFGVAGAYCDAAAGVCRRPLGACGACSGDAECGRNDVNGLPNRCVDGYCAQGCGQCPAGFVCTEGGCVPAQNAGSCATAVPCPDGTGCPDGTRCSDLGVCLAICDGDEECPSGRICWLEPGPLLGQCVDGCTKGDTRESGGQAEVCYANGRWGPPCPTPGSSQGCPSGFECEAQGVCVLPGCGSDADCSVARTYCDVTTRECVEGCNSDDDCGAFELCDTSASTCVKQGCRGKDVSCGFGEWCCGTDAYSDASSCPSGVDDGACFLTPDPFCRTCSDNDDCADIERFGYGSYCYELTRQDDQGNEVSLGKFCSVGCRTNADCPRGVQCQLELPADQGATTQGCIDAVCAGVAAARAP